MISSINKKAWIKKLFIITAIALLGIIGFQTYWLRTSYLEQQSRFRADIESAITAVLIRNLLEEAGVTVTHSPPPVSSPHSLAAVLTSNIHDIAAKQSGKGIGIVSFTSDSLAFIQSRASATEIPSQQSGEKSIESLIMKLNAGKTLEPSAQAYLINFKELLLAELKKRSISTQAELALVDQSGRPVISTIDTSLFRRIPLKSDVVKPDVRFIEGHLNLQAAFPDANVFLLHRMVWALCLSALLIIIGVVSFTMLKLFCFSQKKLDDIRNDFMNNMTHELKTPVSSVSVVLELLKEERHLINPVTKQDYLNIAQKELQRLNMLIEKVLKIAAYENNRISIAPGHFCASEWLHTTINGMKPLLESAGAQISTHVHPESLQLYADKLHLATVIQNLIENALKYSDKAVPFITVCITGQPSAISIEVSDNGKGIPKRHLPKLFDNFFRVPQGNKHEKKGFGLGLSYVQSIARLHGGTATVNSTVGKGSAFTLVLPQ